ncbi:MAG: hypothetical protein JWM33_2340 [Caulobacteraceae bacterium]|nr:hypothetical protein [Caulobacteraceae bacterium]
MLSRWIISPLLAALAITAPVALANSTQAATGLTPVAKQSLSSPEAANRQGLLQLQAHDLDGAIASFSAVISSAPTADAFKYRARAYSAQGKNALALADIDRALKLTNSQALRRTRTQLLSLQARASSVARTNAAPSRQQDPVAPSTWALATQVQARNELAKWPLPYMSARNDPGYWTSSQYDGSGRDSSMASAMRIRADAAFQSQNTASPDP